MRVPIKPQASAWSETAESPPRRDQFLQFDPQLRSWRGCHYPRKTRSRSCLSPATVKTSKAPSSFERTKTSRSRWWRGRKDDTFWYGKWPAASLTQIRRLVRMTTQGGYVRLDEPTDRPPSNNRMFGIKRNEPQQLIRRDKGLYRDL